MMDTTLSKEIINYLKKPRSYFINMNVEVKDGNDGNIIVSSKHVDNFGKQLNYFSTTWSNPEVLNTEYGWGLSVIHDIKDHRFYGLGITTLSEFQTIVQTYYGRAVAFTNDGIPTNNEWELDILSAIDDELFGPRGPRVYGFNQIGLLDEFAPNTNEFERKEAHLHMIHVCFNIMLPPIREIYQKYKLIRHLQASTTKHPQLVHTYLSGVKWASYDRLLLDISENVGINLSMRAYVNDKLYLMSSHICNAINEYTKKYNLIERFGAIFDTQNYLVNMEFNQDTFISHLNP